MSIRIRRLCTGEIEQVESAHFLGGGMTPGAPSGRLEAWGRQEAIDRPDGSIGYGSVMIPTTVWLLETENALVLVDTGVVPPEELSIVHEKYEGSLANDVTESRGIARQLQSLGIALEDIDIIAVSHMHYDHIGGLDLFPNAVIIAHPLEIAWGLCPQPANLYYYPEFRHHIVNVLDRVRLLSSDRQVVTKGIEMAWTGGHSPGHQVVFVETAHGTAVLTGDLIYHYRSLEHDVPSGTNYSVEQTMAGMQLLRTADLILVNHDPLTARLFPNGVGASPVPQDVWEYMSRLRTPGSFSLNDAVSGNPDISLDIHPKP